MAKATEKDAKLVSSVSETPKVGEEEERNTVKAKVATVSLDTSVSDIIQWDTDGMQLIFDQKSFLQLPEGIVQQLKKHNRDAYYVARQNAVNLDKAPTRKPRKMIDPFTNAILQRLNVRKNRYYNDKDRREYHQTFVDVVFVDTFKTMGYRPVRDPIRKAKIIYLMQGDKEEAMLMEVSWHDYEAHLHAMSEKSQERYKANKENIRDKISRLGGTLLDQEDPDDRERMEAIQKAAMANV